MANKGQFGRGRRLAMQAVMWLVFAASLGVASLLTHSPTERISFTSGRTESLDALTFQFPPGWTEGNDRGNGGEVRSYEDRADGRGRTLTLQIKHLPMAMYPQEFLARVNLPKTLVALDEDGKPQHGAPLHVKMANHDGLVTGGIVTMSLINGTTRRNMPGRSYYATTVLLPSPVAVVINLEGLGPPETDDLAILNRVARSLDLKSAAEMAQATTAARTLQFADGTRISIPEGFAPLPQPDHNQTVRTLAGRIDDASLMVDLVPCFLSNTATDTDKIAMAELRDPLFAGGKVAQLPAATAGLRQWKINLDPKMQAPTGLVAYLVADTSGSALLAIFRGDLPDSMDAYWQQIVGGIQFGPEIGLPALTTAGVQAVARMKSIGMEKLTGATDHQNWWIWFRDDAPLLVGWSHQTCIYSGKWTGQTQFRRQDNGVVRLYRDVWQSDNQMGSYSRTTTIEGQTAGSPVQEQQAGMNGGQWAIETNWGTAKLTNHFPLPGNFVPGAWLPLVFSSLKNEPVVLQTDCLPGYEPAMHSGLLTMLIEPSEEYPNLAEDGSGPLRCFTVKVNGSGEISRWYFTPDGDVARIDLAAGLHRRPSNEKEIQNNFNDEDRLRP